MTCSCNPLTKLWEIREGDDLLARGLTKEAAEASLPVKQAARRWVPDENGDLAPHGVELIDPDDIPTRRDRIYDAAVTQLKAAYPVSHGGLRMELHDVDYEDPPDFGPAEQKQAVMENRSLNRRLRGTVRLVDETTEQPLDEKRLTLMRVPHLTDKGVFVNNGSSYSSIMQSRLAPGVYTRRQANGMLESQFNVRPGTGRQFKIGFEPESGQYRLRVGTANLHLYSFLHDMGIPDDDLANRWGSEVLDHNRSKYDRKVFNKAYERLVRPQLRLPDADDEAKRTAINDALNAAQINEQVARRHLPNLFDMRKTAAWRNAEQPVFEPDLSPSLAMFYWAESGIPELVTKLAAFRPEELQAVASFVSKATGTAIDLQGSADELEAAILQAIGVSPAPYDAAMMQAGTDYMAHLSKSAAFDPTLEPDDLIENYNATVGHHGPQLASKRHCPDTWLHAEDPLSWLQWYEQYHAGRRGHDDERQMRRWHAVKAFHGNAFKAKPTARRGFALRNWAIDPLQLVDESQREDVKKQMDEYRAKAREEWEAKK